MTTYTWYLKSSTCLFVHFTNETNNNLEGRETLEALLDVGGVNLQDVEGDGLGEGTGKEESKRKKGGDRQGEKDSEREKCGNESTRFDKTRIKHRAEQ